MGWLLGVQQVEGGDVGDGDVGGDGITMTIRTMDELGVQRCGEGEVVVAVAVSGSVRSRVAVGLSRRWRLESVRSGGGRVFPPSNRGDQSGPARGIRDTSCCLLGLPSEEGGRDPNSATCRRLLLRSTFAAAVSIVIAAVIGITLGISVLPRPSSELGSTLTSRP